MSPKYFRIDTLADLDPKPPVIVDAGHSPFLERPDEFLAALVGTLDAAG